MRKTNLSEIVTTLHVSGPMSRSQLGSATGLTRSAVADLVKTLVDAGLLVETDPEPDGSPGRPSPVVSFSDDVAVLALDLEVDSVAAAVVGFGGRVIAEERELRLRAGRPAPEVASDLAELARRCLARAGSPRLIGVGVAVAGLVERNRNVVSLAPNLGWREVDLAPLIAQRLGIDVGVIIDNEANLFARAESRRGAGRGGGDMVHFTAEVGIGCGFVTDGRLVSGRSGLAGEVGHMVVNPDGQRCSCGSIGCWETEIGERALLARAGLDPLGGAAALAELEDLAAAGDEAALAAYATTGRWVGIGLANIVNLLNPAMVVLGGMYRTGFPYIAEAVSAELASRVLEPLRGVAVVPSELDRSGAVMGAAELALEPALADPLGALDRIHSPA